VTYAGPPQQPLQFLPAYPPIQKKLRKVGAPLGVLILLGTIAGLILIALTAFNPVGTSIGFVLSSVAMTVVVLAYLWLDRWEPEPTRLLVLAFLWGASVAVIIASILQLMTEAAINPGATEGASPVTIVLGAPLTEEAAKGLFLLVMMTGRRRNELNSLTDCLVYAGLVGAGFAWLEDILYIGGGETVGDSLVTAAMRLIMAPFAHSLFTTFFGIGVWYALNNRNALARVGFILLGYLGAVIMHGLWNGSSLVGFEAYLLVYFLWMVPIFGLIIWLGVASRRKEQRITAEKLPGMVAAGLVTPHEATWLGSIKSRKAAIGQAGRMGGRSAAKSVKTFAHQVVELAFARDLDLSAVSPGRMTALLTDETYALYGARAAAPALRSPAGFRG